MTEQELDVIERYADALQRGVVLATASLREVRRLRSALQRISLLLQSTRNAGVGDVVDMANVEIIIIVDEALRAPEVTP
jgi:hypothetical protein